MFGISFPDSKVQMIYKAGITELYDGEGEEKGCEPFTIPKGEYMMLKVEKWAENIPEIGNAFRAFEQSGLKLAPPGIEWYQGEDALCMLKIAE